MALCAVVNDDDREMNSLLNQWEICQVFAEQHGYTIVGQSFDDNISGMSFDRPWAGQAHGGCRR